MPLTKTRLRFLRGKCHALRPIILIGQKGLTEALFKELDIALRHHELIKLRIAADDRAALRDMLDALCRQSGAECVQLIGKSPCLYRRNAEKPKITLPEE